MTATIDDFARLDIRVGRVVSAEPLAGARKPAYAMRIDLGSELGEKRSSAQVCDLYQAHELVGRLVLCVVNLPPRRIAGFESEVLTLGAYCSGGKGGASGPVALIAPDQLGPNQLGNVSPGDRMG